MCNWKTVRKEMSPHPQHHPQPLPQTPRRVTTAPIVTGAELASASQMQLQPMQMPPPQQLPHGIDAHQLMMHSMMMMQPQTLSATTPMPMLMTTSPAHGHVGAAGQHIMTHPSASATGIQQLARTFAGAAVKDNAFRWPHALNTARRARAYFTRLTCATAQLIH